MGTARQVGYNPDSVRCYERKDTGRKFFLCPECESVWELGDDLHEDADMYVSEYLLTGDPAKDWGDHRSVRLRERCVRSRWPAAPPPSAGP